MHSEAEKGKHELEIFKEFLEKSQLPIDPKSIEKREPPEPDILCKHFDGELVAFELVRLCDPNIAKALNNQKTKTGDTLITSDPSTRIIQEKRQKQYKTPHPIELLCYTDGRIITPDDVIVPTIKPYFECDSGPFRHVWFLGESKTELII